MDIRRTTRIVWTFYKEFFLISTLITLVEVYLFATYGFSIFFTLFWFKLALFALVFHFINDRKKKQYYYYYNLGVSKAFLWTVILTFDFSFFISFIVLLSKLK